ncbi:MAG: hypothetical protein KF824_02430 [Fimbriimonadaceae bacterium]|nr:MAG: hypothetical protein KF824_02430 [Fimbriimonadaceae bacterium]
MSLLGMFLVGGGIFFADQERVRFENRAAEDIRAKLNNVQGEVKVKVQPSGLAAAWGELDTATISANNFSINELPLFTEPDRRTSGKIGMLQLRLTDFTLKRLKCAELQADIPGCRYDYGLAKNEKQIRLSRSAIGTGWVRIREADLAEYLVKKFAEIKTCTVKLHGSTVWVEGYGEFLVVNTNFAVIADLGIEDGTKLYLKNAKVFFDWIRADGPAVDVLLKTLNPVVDLKKDMGLYDAVYVEKVIIKDGELKAIGMTKIPTKPTSEPAK